MKTKLTTATYTKDESGNRKNTSDIFEHVLFHVNASAFPCELTTHQLFYQ